MKKKVAKQKLILFILFFVGYNGIYGQNIKNTQLPLTLYKTESGTFILDTVIIFDNVSKEELYKRAKSWIVSNIRTSDKTVIFDDVNFNETRVDATIALSKISGTSVNFKISCYFKENKCKLVYESFMYEYIGQGKQYQSNFENLKVFGVKKIYAEFDSQFSLFNNSFVKKLSTSVNNSDW